jgi:tape measure domain-containing protein
VTTERIEIVVTKTGDKEAQKGLQGIGESAEGAQKPVDGLNSALGFLKVTLASLGVAGVISEYMRLSDTFTGIINRLKLVSTSAQDLASTEKALFDSANRTRSSFEETANLYTKLAGQAANLGIEQKSLIPTIETINQLIAISGASGAEAQAGLLQFSQGLASNRFQGDELKSVLEQLPALGQAIAKGLGTTTGGLRKMGEAGQLSAKIVLDALNKGAPEIAKQFASITPTIQGAFQVLKNNLLQTVGIFDQVNGITAVLANALLFLANNFQTLVRIVLVATAAFASFYAGMYIQAAWSGVTAAIAAFTARVAAANVVLGYAGIQLTTYQKILMALQTPLATVRTAFLSLWAVIAANPITVIIGLIGAAIAALYVFGDAIKLNADGSITAWGAFAGTLQTIWDLMKQLGAWVATVFGPYWKVLGDTVKFVFNLILEGIGWVISKLAILFPSLDGAKQKIDALVPSWIANMKAASNSADATGLATKNFGEFGKASDAVAGSTAEVGKQAKFAGDGMTQMGRVVASAIPPFENLVRAQDKLTAAVAAGKKAFQDNKTALDSTIKAENDLTVTTRDAMGKIITYANAAEAQTASLFGGIKTGAESAADAFDKLAESASTASSAVQAAQQATSTTSSSIASLGDTKSAVVKAGGSSQQADALNAALRTFDVMVGTPAGGPALQRLYTLLSGLPKDASKAFVTNYPYVNSYLQGQGLPTFRNGGDFRVGGSGGADSQLVQFMASPNETVETPSQRRRRLSGGDGGGGGQVVVNMNVSTPDANSFNRSKNQTYLALKSKLAGV